MDTHFKLSLPEGDFINSYAVAYQIVDSAVNSHDKYWQLIKANQLHIKGEKPIPPAQLKKQGMEWSYNFNHGKARAKVEKGTATSISKVASALALGYTTFRNVEESDKSDEVLQFLQDPNKRGIVSSVMGYAFVDMLLREVRLSGFLNELEYPSYAFGYAAAVFDNPDDWAPTPVHPLDIAFRPNTKAHDIKQFVLFDKVYAKDLYTKWVKAKNEESKVMQDESGETRRIATSGWDIVALEKLLFKAFSGKINGMNPETWEEVVQAYNENPSYVITSTNDVTIAKIYNVELDGTLTEVYIPWSNAWQLKEDGTPRGRGNISENDTGDIIFKKNHGKYIQAEWVCVIRDSGFSESGAIQDMRGIAKYAVEDSIRYNRTRNGLGNKMIFAGSPFFENPGTQVAEKFKLTVSQGFVMVPTAYHMLEKQPQFDIQSHLLVMSFEEREFTRDTQQFDASIQGRLTSRPNKDEVRHVSEEVSVMGNAKNNIKLRDYSGMMMTCFKRLGKISSDDPIIKAGIDRFYNNVKKYIPWLVKTNDDVKKIIDAIDSYTIEPVIDDIEVITMAIQMSETPYARNRFKRMLLLARGMPIEEVNNAVPLIVDKFINMQDDRIAAFENDMFWTTNEVVFNGTDDDIIHLDAHIGKCIRVIEGVKNQSVGPDKAYPYLINNYSHSMLHLDKLGQDPILNSKAQEYLEPLKAIKKSINEVGAMAQQMQIQAQQEANKMQLDPETQAEIMREDAKMQRTEERKDYVAQNRTKQKQAQIQMNHELKLQEQQLEQQREWMQER